MPDEEVATVAEFQHARRPGNEPADRLTRQQFLRRAGIGLGAVALSAAGSARGNGVLDHPHVPPKIKRVIY
ncbi:MAG: hypothetical protein VB859_02500, partial [Planctomycetaceae bacterium]